MHDYCPYCGEVLEVAYIEEDHAGLRCPNCLAEIASHRDPEEDFLDDSDLGYDDAEPFWDIEDDE